MLYFTISTEHKDLDFSMKVSEKKGAGAWW